MKQIAGNCPLCQKPFAPEDDVVICPECGAPYHRACYKQEGHCLYQDRHDEGFEYTSAGPTNNAGGTQTGAGAPAQGTAEPGAGTLCPACGTANDGQNIFCEQCGAPLHKKAPAGGAAAPGGRAGAPPPYAPGGPVLAPGLEIAAEIDGIPSQDWQLFVGPSSNVYLQRFTLQQKRNSKIGYLFSAFFLGPFYFAYRKMWLWTLLAFLLQLATSLPGYILLLHEAGAPLVAGLSATVLEMLARLSSWPSMIVNLLTAIFALYLYRLHGRKTIGRLQQQNPDRQAYLASLAKKGGTSVLGPLLVGAALVGGMALFALLFPQDLAAYMNWFAASFYA